MSHWSCGKCGASGQGADRHCPSCNNDLGAPNVREASRPEERDALRSRFNGALQLSSGKIPPEAIAAYIQALNSSRVVVAMPGTASRTLMADRQQLYQNYERLVGGGTRSPAKAQHDRMRKTVAGLLFGTYGEDLVYGALSLSGRGVRSYGPVFCRLRDVAVRDRASFLETNSYVFLNAHPIQPGSEVPPGYRAVWDNRGELAAAKTLGQLQPSDCAEDWEQRMLKDGAERADDDYVEATIFGAFNVDAVESIECSKTGLTKEDKIDAAIALEQFEKRRSERGGGRDK